MRTRRKMGTLATAVTALMLATPSVMASGPPHGDGPYELPAPAFDISAAPDGSILVAGGDALTTIRHGEVETVNSIPLDLPVSGANGVAAVGTKNAYVATGGADQALDAAVWRVTPGQVQLVGDITAFETAHDPDAAVWKHPDCEEDPAGGFTAGPQSNPYHLAHTGDEVLLADAAGNTVYAVGEAGVELVAVMTPPVDGPGYMILGNDQVTGEQDCYVQPVPTAVAIGDDGSYYVGELTGVTPGGLPIGLSRVWKIAPGARGAVCSELAPDPACELLIDGLTSVIDVELGRDGKLYVVENDANSWLAAFIPGAALGGSVKACDVTTGACDPVADGLAFPGAITFDKWDQLWLLENVFAPTVRRL